LSGVFVSGDGLTAFVPDSGTHNISVWTRSSATSADWTNETAFGGAGSEPGRFLLPRIVFMSADSKTAFGADSDNNRISICTRSTESSTGWINETTFRTFRTRASEF